MSLLLLLLLKPGPVSPPQEAHPSARAGDPYTSYSATYRSNATGARMVTTADVYAAPVIFTQSFPDGAAHTANGDRDSVLSSFPSFKVEALASLDIVDDSAGSSTNSAGLSLRQFIEDD